MTVSFDEIMPGGVLDAYFTDNRLRVSMFILFVELCERFTFYTIYGSMKAFLQDHHFSQSHSTSISLVFSTTCYLWTIAGSICTDAYYSRYTVIAISLITYLIGGITIIVATLPTISSTTMYLTGTMLFIASAMGCMKPNIHNFGAEQVLARQRASFLSWVYWFINIGALVAFGYMTTLASNGSELTKGDGGVPKEYGFSVAYACATGAIALCTITFFCGSRWYRHSEPSTSNAPMALVSAIYHSRHTSRGRIALLGWLLWPVFFFLVIIQAFTMHIICAHVSLFVGIVLVISLVYAHYDNSWITIPRTFETGPQQDMKDGDSEPHQHHFTLSQIQDTFRSLPVIFVVNVVFGFGYSMTMSTFLSQACQMQVRLTPEFQISGSFLNVTDCLAIIIFVPIVDYLFRRVPVSMNTKVLCGFVSIVFAMAVAAAIEIERRKAPVLNEGASCAPNINKNTKEKVRMSDLSAFYMFAPYVLVGIGEIFVNPMLYYYAYTTAPPAARNIVQAINMIAQGAIPSALSSCICTIFSHWHPNDLNEGSIENFYYLTIGACLVGLPVFYFVDRSKEDVKMYFLAGSIVDEALRRVGLRMERAGIYTADELCRRCDALIEASCAKHCMSHSNKCKTAGLCMPTFLTVNNVCGFARPPPDETICISPNDSQSCVDKDIPQISPTNDSQVKYFGCCQESVLSSSPLGHQVGTATVLQSQPTDNFDISDIDLRDASAPELVKGTVVKIGAGCHVDGHIAQASITVVVGEVKIIGRKADVLRAAWTAAEAAARSATVGATSTCVIKAICKVARTYECAPVEGVVLRQVMRNKMTGNKTTSIHYGVNARRVGSNSNVAVRIVNGYPVEMPGFEFAPREAYVVDVMMSTGYGFLRKSQVRPSVFTATETLTTMTKEEFDALSDTTRSFLVELDASLGPEQTLLSWKRVGRTQGIFPFTLHDFEQEFGEAVVDDVIRQKLIEGYCIMVDDAKEYLAQFTFTLLITDFGYSRVTRLPLALYSHVESEYKVYDESLLDLFNTSFDSPEHRRSNKPMKVKSLTALNAEFQSDEEYY